MSRGVWFNDEKKNRINFGSGPVYAKGWYNLDNDQTFQTDFYLEGDNTAEYVVAHHSLQCIDPKEFDEILKDIYNCLKPGGIFRISIPDILSGFEAYKEKDLDYFPKMNGEEIDERFCHWLTWYGQNINPLTETSLKSALTRNGFKVLELSRMYRTNCNDKDILELDTRYLESVYVEASK